MQVHRLDADAACVERRGQARVRKAQLRAAAEDDELGIHRGNRCKVFRRKVFEARDRPIHDSLVRHDDDAALEANRVDLDIAVAIGGEHVGRRGRQGVEFHKGITRDATCVGKMKGAEL